MASAHDKDNGVNAVTISPQTPIAPHRERSRVSRVEPPCSGQPRDSSADYWRLAAMIADRIMFVVFLLAVSVTFIVVLATVSQECEN